MKNEAEGIIIFRHQFQGRFGADLGVRFGQFGGRFGVPGEAAVLRAARGRHAALQKYTLRHAKLPIMRKYRFYMRGVCQISLQPSSTGHVAKLAILH